MKANELKIGDIFSLSGANLTEQNQDKEYVVLFKNWLGVVTYRVKGSKGVSVCPGETEVLIIQK